MPLFLIRHPRPAIESGVCYGRLDLQAADPLSFVRELAPQLPSGTTVISSPLSRARLPAEMLAARLGADMRIDPRLREIDFGDWEGLRWDDIDCAQIDAWAADILHFIPPGGEAVAALQARAIDFARCLENKNAIIVTHAGILRALLGYWRQLPDEIWTQLSFDYGEVTVLGN